MPNIPQQHPILGNVFHEHHQNVVGRIYTRTVVLWAHGIRIDPALLWEQVAVQDRHDGPIITKEEDLISDPATPGDPPRVWWQHRKPSRGRITRTAPGKGSPTRCCFLTQHQEPSHRPVVRMMTTATKRRGHLSKRMRSAQSFRSVLSMDVEFNGNRLSFLTNAGSHTCRISKSVAGTRYR